MTVPEGPPILGVDLISIRGQACLLSYAAGGLLRQDMSSRDRDGTRSGGPTDTGSLKAQSCPPHT